MKKIIAAALQLSTGSNKEANLERAERLVKEAAARGAQLIALPEMFNWRGKKADELLQAEDLNGPTLTLMASLARKLGVYLLAGSIAEKIPGHSKSYNTSVLFGPDGSSLAVYRKIHLFDVELPDGRKIRESDTKESGERVVVAEVPFGKIGLTVCYDIRFPELYRCLASLGATIITIPSAFTFTTGEAHWEVLIRARAIENQAFVIAPAQFGHNVHGFLDYGNSMIVDPWGRVLARMGDSEGFTLAELDLEYLERLRSTFPVLQHRKLHEVPNHLDQREARVL